RERAAHRMREADVRHQPIAKKCGSAAHRAIDELIRHDEIERAVLLLERTDRGERKDSLHAQSFHAINVRAIVQLRRRVAMASPMARKERHFMPDKLAHDVFIGRPAPRRLDTALFFSFESGHRVQPAAPDNSNRWFHACMSSRSKPPAEAGCTNT